MHELWFWYALTAVAAWGVAGLLQKLATNHVSAESALIWLVVGFLLLSPLMYPGRAIGQYPLRSTCWALLGGALNALGSWALFAALKSGGKASVVVPFTALYPMVVVIAALMILHESLTGLQIGGVVCGLGAVLLLSA
jgi:bacterial/archaeal transporter family protein